MNVEKPASARNEMGDSLCNGIPRRRWYRRVHLSAESTEACANAEVRRSSDDKYATTEMPDTAFKISPEKQQLIGVQYSTVEYQTISKSLRAVGKVAFDETKMSRINPKIEGWIENVYVDFTGKLVKKGQPLLSIYSPDLVSTQEEYLLAIKGRRQLEESPFPEAVNFSESLVQSARRRLELWDITDKQISELEKRGTLPAP